ncbi:hypothetical protein N8467_00800 [bacterium]|nr:hypothetical protein [bacterium]
MVAESSTISTFFVILTLVNGPGYDVISVVSRSEIQLISGGRYEHHDTGISAPTAAQLFGGLSLRRGRRILQ